MKTEIEKMIEEQYQNCHIPVLCKNKTYADAATGRKADPKIAEEEGKVKFISASMQYVNQKLDKPIYHEFIWIENRIIHHKVICAFRINKHESYYKVVLQGYVDMKLEIEYLDRGILRTEEIIAGGTLR